uniref:HMA domain-containing protein n=1 Tax=Panagrellus redivivus TaxID=6233 RepID=A0A7E4VGJ8_PANRE
MSNYLVFNYPMTDDRDAEKITTLLNKLEGGVYNVKIDVQGNRVSLQTNHVKNDVLTKLLFSGKPVFYNEEETKLGPR